MKNYAPVNEDYDIPTKKYIDDLISQIQSAVSSAQSAASAASTAAAQAQSAASSAASAAASAQTAAEAASSKADSAQSTADTASSKADSAQIAADAAQVAADTAAAAAETAQTTADGKAPKKHATSATTYGKGTSSAYGHLKLSASTSSTSGESGGIAATPSAVKSAYDLANTANTNATLALNTRLNGYRIIIGSFSMPFATAAQNLTVSFGVTFAEKPAVVCTQVFDSMNVQIRDNYITTTQFRATLSKMTSSGSRTVLFIAVGKA